MSKDDSSLILSVLGILVLLIMSIGIMTFFLFPSYFIFVGDWTSFIYWIPIVGWWSRVLHIISIPLYLVLAVIKKKGTYIVAALADIPLVVWGIPLLYNAYLNLSSLPLSGVELQRNILIIIFITSWSITMSLLMKKNIGDDD